jgi:hypothetical protein
MEHAWGKMKYWYIILLRKRKGKHNFGTQKDRGVDSSKIFKFILKNKKFWEELIAYFSRYDMDSIENGAPNNSFLRVCSLPPKCFTEPLPNNDKGYRYTE